jgi:tetraacyldisaccharide 4'-kinase
VALADLAGWIYARAARRRRAWYTRHADRRRRLAEPVVSVGNLRVGGSGKTPAVRHIAEVLRQLGERPAVLSRGYARRRPVEGVVVVCDGLRIRADLDRSGDEPLMLARTLPGVGVFVSSDRYLAGLLAERRFGATVHILDDGFQHFQLERQVDLLLVSSGDLAGARTLPFGHLREPSGAASAADALVFAPTEEAEEHEVGEGRPTFVLRRKLGAARLVEGGGLVEPGDARVLMVAGIARPERFRSDLQHAGWQLAGERLFGDHERFSRATVAEITAAARAARADLVLTTEKDLVRLLRFRPMPVPVAWVPLSVSIEPAGEFRVWLAERLALSRELPARRLARLKPGPTIGAP